VNHLVQRTLSLVAAKENCYQRCGSSHDYPGLVAIFATFAVGAAIGAFQGSFIAFLGVPSFVVTLAGLLIWQGVILKALGTHYGALVFAVCNHSRGVPLVGLIVLSRGSPR
jgi:ABC-type xylose transport system permease subunit